MDNSTNRELDRPIVDFLLGYRNPGDNKIIPGVLERLDRLEQQQTWYIRIIMALALANFFGVHTVRDVIGFFSSLH